VKAVREDEYTEGIAIWEFTKSVTNADDAYGRSSITSGSRFFSGSVAWGRTFKREGSEGGDKILSDVTIVCDHDEKDFIERDNVYLVVSGQRLVVKDTIDVLDTDEIVIYCERYK